MRGADENEIHPKCPACRLSWSAISEREADQRRVGGPPAPPAHAEPQDQERPVHRPRQHRQHDQRIEVGAVPHAGEAGGHAQREHRQRERDGSSDERLERDERGRAEAKHRRAAPLELPLLPEVEPRERGRERQAREAREQKPDVQDEEERRVPGLPGCGDPAGRVGHGEQERGERHHDEAEQADTGAGSPRSGTRRRRARRRGSASPPTCPRGSRPRERPGRRAMPSARASRSGRPRSRGGPSSPGAARRPHRRTPPLRRRAAPARRGAQPPLLLPRRAGQVGQLLLEPSDLERDDDQVGEQRPEQDEIGRGHVLLGRRHASSSRSSRRLASMRLPASSTR